VKECQEGKEKLAKKLEALEVFKMSKVIEGNL
jgi:hypothetical protein